MWLEGVIGIPANKTTGRSAVVVHYILKAYDKPSKFGINNGKIS